MATYKNIVMDISDKIATITINRPPNNILNIETMKEINDAIINVKKNKAKIMILNGAGEKAFSTGVDIADHTEDKAKEMISVFHDIFRNMLQLDALTVAAVKGYALGGGFELVMFCDMVVAAENAKFGQPEIKLSLFPPIACIILPGIIPMKKAMEILLTGEMIDADGAMRLGLVNRIYPLAIFDEEFRKFIEVMKTISPVGIRFTKRAVATAAGRDFHSAITAVEELYLNELMKTHDANEGLAAFIEKRKPQWKGE
ncbi:MAG: enoyl-CoA hydratase/isomerase family protein [Candidatus Aenigmatarchaeota archaeon]